MKRAYKMQHLTYPDWTSRPRWLLSDTGQWAESVPEGYEAASAAQWVQDGRPMLEEARNNA